MLISSLFNDLSDIKMYRTIYKYPVSYKLHIHEILKKRKKAKAINIPFAPDEILKNQKRKDSILQTHGIRTFSPSTGHGVG